MSVDELRHVKTDKRERKQVDCKNVAFVGQLNGCKNSQIC